MTTFAAETAPLDADAAPVSSGDAVAPVHRMLWRPVPVAEVPAAPDSALRGARIIVFGGRAEVARRVAEALRRCGADAVVDGDAVGGDGAWTVAGRPPHGLVDLTFGEPFVPGAHGGYRAALLRTVSAIRACYPQWVQEERSDQLFYLAVTYLGGLMGYQQDKPGQPLGGIWAGLAKTLHRELPNCNTRILDIDATDATSTDGLDALPERICRELYRWGAFEIGYHGGRRYSLEPWRAPAGPAGRELRPQDLVLVSGGGRGIGWELATALTRRTGCAVVVTGRGPLPSESSAPWATVDDAAFARYERELWTAGRAGRSIPEIRAALQAARRDRELISNLRAAQDAGLRISYAPCDFTDPAAVAALVGPLRNRLTGVVHNAGVDSPARLPKKSDDDFLGTVVTKVDGFVNLFEQVRDLPLAFFCNVGSLTGRLGGMVGQLDYGAANDGLARLGLWARTQAAFPVMTLCWPTWDHVGMVANFTATLRYMKALGVEEGVRLWLAELAAGTSGEVTYVGPLGRALTPVQARGYPVTPDLPGYADLLPPVFHLGEVLRQRPHAEQRAVVGLQLASAPVLGDVLVGGTPSLPVSLLLENALQGGDWLPPPDFEELVFDRFEDITAAPRALRLSDGGLRLTRIMSAGYRDGVWCTDIRYRTMDAAAHEAARMRLVYRAAHQPPAPEPATTTTTTVATTAAGAARPRPAAGARRPARDLPLSWRGMVLPRARWTATAAHTERAVCRREQAADLWALPHWPEHRLPMAAIENILRRCADRAAAGPELSIARIDLGRPPAEVTAGGPLVVTGAPWSGNWTVTDERTAHLVLRLENVRYRGAE